MATLDGNKTIAELAHDQPCQRIRGSVGLEVLGERDYEVFYMGRANYLKSHAHLRLGSTVRNTASGPTRIHRREATRRGISGVRASR